MGQNQMLTIVDYDMGNVRSVAKAFELLGVKTVVSHDAEAIKKADYLILPGVGAFGDGMANLKKYGLMEILNEEVLVNKKPILGICLGMQLMAKSSQEFGHHQGLGWLDAEVTSFEFEDNKLKVPHVGWNEIEFKENCPLFNGIKQKTVFYFVHSYYFKSHDQNIVAATCNYGFDFTAAIQQNNIFATQFHPEKSQTYGLQLLKNFLNWQS